jgi:putative nucleotidyltransferase with HDIG domain
MIVTDQNALKHRIEQLIEVPTLPIVIQKITAVIERQGASAEDIGRIIETDQALTAKVLRLANSAFYGFPGRIGSVSHAVVVLGVNVVKGLTLGASVFDMMVVAGMDQLWRHSLGVGAAARVLANQIGLKNVEEVFTAGLLHDIGKVVLAVKAPELATRVDATIRERDCTQAAAEQVVMGFTHTDIAGWLATAWHLPTVLKDPIAFHHDPGRAVGAVAQTRVVHVADVLVKAMGCGESLDDQVPPLSPDAWQALNLDDQALAACLAKIAEEFDTIDDYL